MLRTDLRGSLLAILILTGCGLTDSPSPPPSAFPGTLLVERWAAGGGIPPELPVAIAASNEEFQVFLDVSPYFPGDDSADYVTRVLDFDASRDGHRLYAAVYTKVAQYDLPFGGPLHEVIDLGHPVSKVRVSPDGSRLAVRRAIEDDIVIFRADGTGAQVALPAANEPGVSRGPPVWVGNDRVMVVEQRATIEGLRFRFLDMRAPAWIAAEYLPLQGAIPPGRGGVVLLAHPDGDRLYLVSCGGDPSWQCRLVEYPIDGFQGTHRLTVDDRTTGGSWVLSPDGLQVATRGGDQVIVFDLRTGQRVGEPVGIPGRTEAPVAWVAAEYQ